jgi:hypothetical protein
MCSFVMNQILLREVVVQEDFLLMALIFGHAIDSGAA